VASQTECPSFIDSTQIKVCHNLRIKSNKVFRELAKRGKTGAGWFYGFKVHLVISDCHDLLAVMTTPGNVDDRKPAPRLARRLFGKLFGDRGHISKEPFALLWEPGVRLATKIKKNMSAELSGECCANRAQRCFDPLPVSAKPACESELASRLYDGGDRVRRVIGAGLETAGMSESVEVERGAFELHRFLRRQTTQVHAKQQPHKVDLFLDVFDSLRFGH